MYFTYHYRKAIFLTCLWVFIFFMFFPLKGPVSRALVENDFNILKYVYVYNQLKLRIITLELTFYTYRVVLGHIYDIYCKSSLILEIVILCYGITVVFSWF